MLFLRLTGGVCMYVCVYVVRVGFGFWFYRTFRCLIETKLVFLERAWCDLFILNIGIKISRVIVVKTAINKFASKASLNCAGKSEARDWPSSLMKSVWWLVKGNGTMAADSRLNILKSGINIKKIWALYRLYCVCIQYLACIYVKWNGGQDTIRGRCDMRGSTLLASTRKVGIDSLIYLCQRCPFCWWVGY